MTLLPAVAKHIDGWLIVRRVRPGEALRTALTQPPARAVTDNAKTPSGTFTPTTRGGGLRQGSTLGDEEARPERQVQRSVSAMSIGWCVSPKYSSASR
jgi:hypothetical protein